MTVLTKWHREGYERWQDCEDIIENNKRLQNEDQSRHVPWRHMASVPCIWIEKWLREEWDRGNVNLKWSDDDYDALMRRKLQDPDYRFLRTDKQWR
jgi:hypothetical protein